MYLIYYYTYRFQLSSYFRLIFLTETVLVSSLSLYTCPDESCSEFWFDFKTLLPFAHNTMPLIKEDIKLVDSIGDIIAELENRCVANEASRAVLSWKVMSKLIE